MTRAFLFVVLALVASIRATTYTNPIRTNSADPFFVWGNGSWYLTNTGSGVTLINAPTVAQLQGAKQQTVYADSDPSRNVDFWAPEIHNFGGIWYIFYTASSSTNEDQGRGIHVLKGGSTPAGPYTYAAQLDDLWGIDPTVLFDGGNHYLVWSCRSGGLTGTQYICIGELDGPTSLLNRDNSFPVNEAPSAVYYNGRTFLTYSASTCSTSEYSLGLLSYNGGRVLNASSWSKSGPVFTSTNGDYGPGHNGFVLNPGTSQDWWQVYHATPVSTGACDASRNTFFQPIDWNSDGTPSLGQPEATGTSHPGPSGE